MKWKYFLYKLGVGVELVGTVHFHIHQPERLAERKSSCAGLHACACTQQNNLPSTDWAN